jgi:hypothetical protein
MPLPPAPAATSTFGAFGATAAKPAGSPFGAPAAASPFGATAPAAGGGLFGGSTPFSFSSQSAAAPSLFGAASAAAGTGGFASSLFGGGAFGAAAPAGGGLFGGAAAAPAAAPAAPPSVSAPAYGSFSSLPAVPEARVGITSRPVGRSGSISAGAGKASPLLSLRAVPPRYGAALPARAREPAAAAGFLPPSGSSTTLLSPSAGASGFSLGVTAGRPLADVLSPQAPAGGGAGPLPLRQNPHRLFIAAPPPSTEAAGGGSYLSPARPPARSPAPEPSPLDDAPHAAHEEEETPRARANGANGYAGANGAAAPPAAAAAAAGGFRDSPSSEPQLPRLGRLLAEGYAFSPNPDELRLLHSQNAANLAAVSNFTISRGGVGQVRRPLPYKET